MSNRFLQFHNVRLAEQERKKAWTEEMRATFKKVDQGRDDIRHLITQFEEHLRNKYSDKEQGVADYRSQPGYQEEMKELRRLKGLEDSLYSVLYKISKY